MEVKAKIVLLSAILFYFHANFGQSLCIPGETWYENCKKCRCSANLTSSCERGPCLNDDCVPGSVWFGENYRCHCLNEGGKSHTVCVEMVQQKDLANQVCKPGSTFYDACNLCDCDPKTNRTICRAYNKCWQTKGGVCNQGETFYDRCHKCRCSHSNFRVCEYDDRCVNQTRKPGLCANHEKLSLITANRLVCFLLMDQECFSDYGCPGDKKCCSFGDCYMRCVDPL